MANHIRARPRMVVATLIGVAAGLSYPSASPVTRWLVGWNVGVWLYLVLIALSTLRADHARLRRAALAHAEGAVTVSVTVIAATLASFAAIVLELAAAKAMRDIGAPPHAIPQIALTLVTVAGSWLLLPTLFMLNYATLYYKDDIGTGLRFPPDLDREPRPTYADFAYFSFTIAVALQTADVAITTTQMRQLVLAQSVLSFLFNTAILAFLVNIAASLF